MTLRRTALLGTCLATSLTALPFAGTAAAAAEEPEYPVVAATRAAVSAVGGFVSEGQFSVDGALLFTQQVGANSTEFEEVRFARFVDTLPNSSQSTTSILAPDPAEEGAATVYLSLPQEALDVAGAPYEWGTLGGFGGFALFLAIGLASPLSPAQTLAAEVEEGRDPQVRNLADGAVEYTVDLVQTELEPDGGIRGGFDSSGGDPYPDSETTMVTRVVDDVVIASEITTVYTDGTEVSLAHTFGYEEVITSAPAPEVTLNVERTTDLITTVATAQALGQVSKRVIKATRKGRWTASKVEALAGKIAKKVVEGTDSEVLKVTRVEKVVTVSAPDYYRGGKLSAQFVVKRGKVTLA